MPPSDIFLYIIISLACSLAGAGAGFVGGLVLGGLLSLGYKSRGPSDPGDAPAYVALGLMLFGTFLGAIAGLAIGVVICVRMARRKAANQSESL